MMKGRDAILIFMYGLLILEFILLVAQVSLFVSGFGSPLGLATNVASTVTVALMTYVVREMSKR